MVFNSLRDNSVYKTPGKIIADHLEVAPVCDSHMLANPLALLLSVSASFVDSL